MMEVDGWSHMHNGLTKNISKVFRAQQKPQKLGGYSTKSISHNHKKWYVHSYLGKCLLQMSHSKILPTIGNQLDNAMVESIPAAEHFLNLFWQSLKAKTESIIIIIRCNFSNLSHQTLISLAYLSFLHQMICYKIKF